MGVIKKHCNILVLFGFSFLLLFLPLQGLAFCPLCVVATGTLTGLARWLGVDDTIIGLWLGGFVLSTFVFLNNFLARKWKKIKFQLVWIILLFYGLVVGGLYWAGFIQGYNKILGLNKIILGMAAGSLLIAGTPFLDKFLRRRNEGKIFISHQKMLLALALLLIFSFVFYLITK